MSRSSRALARGASGRGIAELTRDFGHQLPPRVARVVAQAAANPFDELVGKRGLRGRASGWAAVPAPLATYRMTSEQVGGVWPLISSDGLPPTGALMGLDFLSGGAFYADPIGWTVNGIAGVTNPNIMIFGAPGQGKSGTVKIFCLRKMTYGYRTLILGDVKDEYEALCRALGVEPHAVGHGLGARINPLDFGPLGNHWTALPSAELPWCSAAGCCSCAAWSAASTCRSPRPPRPPSGTSSASSPATPPAPPCCARSPCRSCSRP